MRGRILFAMLLATAGIGAMPAAQASEALLKKYNCTACHAIDRKLVGPAYKDVAKKYRGQKDAAAMLARKVKNGGKGAWGQVPMPPNPAVPDADLKKMLSFILAL